MRSAQRILDTWQFDAAASIVETVDDIAATEDEDAAGEVSRRGLFSQARSALAEAATDAASAQMDALTGRSTADAPEPEPDRRRWQLLDDLHAAGLPAGDAVVPRALAPRVDIDPERCSGCALLEFDAAVCRDCGTCTETCRYGAISCEETLTVSELFALEPRAIVIPKRRVLPSRR